MEPVLELVRITKRFSGVTANDAIHLELYPGEILALLGENGAGKTTLMNILYGLLRPDEGEIRIRGQACHIASPRDSLRHGIGMVHQHFMLVPTLSVMENIVLGDAPRAVPGPRRGPGTHQAAGGRVPVAGVAG
jgi:simple sugar transport system ATP-binding protein